MEKTLSALLDEVNEYNKTLSLDSRAEVDEYLRRFDPFESRIKKDTLNGLENVPWETLRLPSEDALFEEGESLQVGRHYRYDRHNVHRHDYIEIFYVYFGDCEAKLGASEVRLSAGDLCILPVGFPHAFYLGHDRDAAIKIELRISDFEARFSRWLSYDNLLTDYFRRTLLGAQQSCIRFSTHGDPVVRGLFADLMIEYRPRRAMCEVIFESLMTMLFCRLIRDHLDGMTAGCEPPRNQCIGTILRLIREDPAHISLDRLCAETHYSKNHLCRLIRENTGHTFTELVNGQRVTLACHHLESGSRPIREIAELCGFSCLEHFYRMFKRTVGVPPAVWRREKQA